MDGCKDRVRIESAAAVVDVDVANHSRGRGRPEILQEAEQITSLSCVGGSAGGIALCSSESGAFAKCAMLDRNSEETAPIDLFPEIITGL